ncbi:MAG: hypothetical protein HYT73_00660 [Candidatus Aenigmarchaeota archaeon]|nr:hypothetical protein [Candidatus Aenigmarchaeota archaeon]
MPLGKHYAAILCLLLASVSVIYYFNTQYLHPPGKVPVIGSDEVVWMDSAKAVLWDFRNPFFFNEGRIFHDPFPGSPYIMAFIGVVFYVTAVDPATILIALKFVFLFLLFAAAYEIMRHFFPESGQRNAAFLLYATLGGIGGLAYIIFFAVNGSVPGLYEGVMLFTGITKPDSAIYHVVSLFFGFASVLMMLKRKHFILIGLGLGMSALIYPIFGAAFFLAALIHGAIIKDRKCVPALITGLLVALPWAISYIQYPDIIESIGAQKNYINPAALLLQGFFIITLSAAYLIKRPKMDSSTRFMAIFAVLLALASMIPPQVNPVTNAQRFIWIIFLPFAILGTKGMYSLFKKDTARKISAAIIIISSLTFFAGNARIITAEPLRIQQNEYDAVKFLRMQEFGNVLTTESLGDYVPYIAEKRSHHTLFYRENGFFPKLRQARDGMDASLMADMVAEYDIAYIIAPEGDALDSMAFSMGYKIIYDEGGFRIFSTA